MLQLVISHSLFSAVNTERDEIMVHTSSPTGDHKILSTPALLTPLVYLSVHHWGLQRRPSVGLTKPRVRHGWLFQCRAAAHTHRTATNAHLAYLPTAFYVKPSKMNEGVGGKGTDLCATLPVLSTPFQYSFLFKNKTNQPTKKAPLDYFIYLRL